METINIAQLEKIARGTAKLAPGQHIPYKSDWDKDDAFILVDKTGTVTSTLEVEKKGTEILSIEKTVVSGDAVEYFAYYPEGQLKEKNIYLKSPPVLNAEKNIYYDNVKTGTHYVFDRSGNVSSQIDYRDIYAYSHEEITAFCEKTFPGKTVTIGQVYYPTGIEAPASSNKLIKEDYPYWSLNVVLEIAGRTIKSETYLIDGKTGTVLNKSATSVTMGMDDYRRNRKNN